MQRLKDYRAIGWDFDGVLHHHPKTTEFLAFIREHPEKRHVIMTFRCHGWQYGIFLRQRQNLPLFNDVLHIDSKMLRTRLNKMARRFDRAPFAAAEAYVQEWKGRMCKQHDVPVLIDDQPDQVLPGCRKYGIEFIHPDDL